MWASSKSRIERFFQNDGFSINKMTRASNYQIRSNGCNYIQTCNFVGIVNWLITTCVLSFGNYLLYDNSSAEGRGKHGCKLSCNCIISKLTF